jgi:uncharacterized membrane protein
MFSWIEVGDVPARKLLAAYFARVDRALAPLSREEADAVRQELETHILDAMAGTPAGETDARAALEQLGDPDEFIPQLVSDRLRARAGRTFGPLDVASAILRTAATGIRGLVTAVVTSIGYLVATVLIFLGVLKLTTSQDVGVFRLSTGELFIGADSNVDGVDLLGVWFAPLAIVAGIVLYLLITWAYGRVKTPRAARPSNPSNEF